MNCYSTADISSTIAGGKLNERLWNETCNIYSRPETNALLLHRLSSFHQSPKRSLSLASTSRRLPSPPSLPPSPPLPSPWTPSLPPSHHRLSPLRFSKVPSLPFFSEPSFQSSSLSTFTLRLRPVKPERAVDRTPSKYFLCVSHRYHNNYIEMECIWNGIGICTARKINMKEPSGQESLWNIDQRSWPQQSYILMIECTRRTHILCLNQHQTSGD